MTEPTEEFTDLVTRKREWEKLLALPEWGKLMRVLQEQADSLQRQIVFQPLGCMDEALTQEFRKGQLVGLLSVSSTVETELSIIQSEIDAHKGNVNG